MADRTPRLLWQNYAQLSGTLLTVSDEQAAFTRAYLGTPLRTQQWRSLVGWTVVAGVNDKVYFSEGGVGRIGTVAPGTYVTRVDYATAVQGAMNTAPGHSNTYTVDGAGAAPFISVARATGSASVSLLYAAPAADSVHVDMGFASTDHVGATFYLGDNAVYHSRHWVKFDIGANMSISVAAVIGHLPLSAGGLIVFDSNTTDSFPNSAVNLAGTNDMQILFFAARNHRYVRFTVSDVGNPLGYSAIGVAAFGSYFEPSRSVKPGFEDRRNDLSSYVKGEMGGFFQMKRVAEKEWQLLWPRLRKTDRDAFDAMLDFLGVGRPFFLSLDPQNFPAEARYGALKQGFSHVQSVGDGNPPDRFTVQVVFTEQVQ